MTETVRNWHLVEVGDIDRSTAQSVADFLNSFGSEERDRKRNSADYFLWKLRDNPAGRGVLNLAMHEGNIVGVTTATAKRAIFHGQEKRVVEIGDTYTSPTHQRQGIFSSLVKATVENAVSAGYEAVYGTPNDQSLPGYEAKLNFLRMPGIELFLWVFPIRLDAVMRATSPDFPLQRLSRPLGAISSSYAGLGRRLAAGVSRIGLQEVRQRLTGVESISREKADFLIARDVEALQHRISDNPEADRYRVYLHAASGGYAVCKVTTERGVRAMFVADLLAHTAGWRSLWASAVHGAVEQRCDLVAIWAPRAASVVLKMAPFPAVPIDRKEVILYNDGMGAEILRSDPSRFRFSVLDSDNI